MAFDFLEDGMVTRRHLVVGPAFLVGLHILGPSSAFASLIWSPPKADYESKSVGEILLYAERKLVLPIDGQYRFDLTKDFDIFAIVGAIGSQKSDTAAIIFSTVRIHKNETNAASKLIFVNKIDQTVPKDSKNTIASTSVPIPVVDYENWHSGSGETEKENSADELITKYHAILTVAGESINSAKFRESFLLPVVEDDPSHLTRASTLLRIAQGGPRQFDTGGFGNEPIRAHVRIFSVNCEFEPLEVVLHHS
jgi:hypothetical protein